MPLARPARASLFGDVIAADRFIVGIGPVLTRPALTRPVLTRPVFTRLVGDDDVDVAGGRRWWRSIGEGLRLARIGCGCRVRDGQAAFGLRLAALAAARTPARCGFLLRRFLVGRVRFGGFFGEQSVAVGLGDLIIVGMNFRERQKPVAVSAIVHKGRLERRLDPRYLGEVDISRELPFVKRLEVKFVNLGSVHHHNTRLFGVRGIDQHFSCHDFSQDRGTTDALGGVSLTAVHWLEQCRAIDPYIRSP